MSDRNTLHIPNVRKYWAFARVGMRKILAYRLNASMNLVNAALFLILSYAIWNAIAASGELRTSLTDVMTYIVLGQVISQSVFVSVENVLGQKIREGSIANELKRPISLRVQTYFELLGRALFNMVAFGLPILALGIVFVDMQLPSAANLAAFGLALFLSFNLVFMLSYSTAMMIFWTKVDWSIRQMRHTVQELFSGVLFPLYLLPPWLAGIFNVLPFQSMVDGPISIFRMEATGNAMFTVLGKQMVWIAALFILSELMWRKAKQKLTVQGG